MPPDFKWLNAALAVQRLCQEREWPFAFIGGVAVQRWGEPRITQDVDLTLYVGFGGEEAPELMMRLEECRRRSETV